MKKLLFALLASIFLFANSAFADEEQIDYSLMNAPLPENVFQLGEIPEVDFDFPVLFSERLSEEEIIYQSFVETLSPENLKNISVVSLGGDFFAEVRIDIEFFSNNNLGTIEEQANLKIKEINEIYSKFLADNPEYFYLRPNSYAYGHQDCGTTFMVAFAPQIGPDFPDFDGSKKSLEVLKTKYDELVTVINNAKDELMFDGMTDLDKLLLAHDYIIDKNAYYLEVKEDGTKYYGDGYSYNAYGILVNKKGVCQGLSYAYPALLKAMGYPTENIRQIISDELTHMWNFVKLGTKWYHVDLTWDDPTVIRQAGDLYDMNDESLQYEYHNHFLISDETNTVRRNEAGYYNFTLEILGYDDNDHTLANDKSYESGYIFNDFVNNSLISVPGRVEYDNGYYKKYYANNDVYFNYDTIKAPSYAVSQLYNNNSKFIFMGAKERNIPSFEASLYACYYDKDGRFLKTEIIDKTFDSFGFYDININKPSGADMTKIITVNKGTFIPIANVPTMK